MDKRLSVKDTVIFAFTTIFSRTFYFIGVTIGIFLLSQLALGVGMITFLWGLPVTFLIFKGSPLALLCLACLAVALFFIAILVWTIFLLYVPIKVALAVRNEGVYKINFTHIWRSMKVKILIKLLTCQLLFMAMVSAGFCLLIVPGLYLLTKLQFAPFYIVDEKCGIIEAFKKSYQLTTGNFAPLLGIVLIAYIFIGIRILWLVGFLMGAYSYHWLQTSHSDTAERLKA